MRRKTLLPGDYDVNHSIYFKVALKFFKELENAQRPKGSACSDRSKEAVLR